MRNLNFERNFIINQNGTIQYILSENPTKIEVKVLIITVSLTSYTGNRGAPVHVYFRNDIGVLLLEQVR